MADVLRHAVGDRTVTLTHVSLSWHGEFWPFRHPLDYVGSDGGGGVGGGPGISVGAALALKGTGRLPIAVCGDGDFLMGCHGGLDCGALPHPAAVRGGQQPLVLQRRGASGARRAHAQPPGRQQVDRPAHRDPDIDIAAMARAQGAKASARSPRSPISKGVRGGDRRGRGGAVAVVDVRVEPRLHRPR